MGKKRKKRSASEMFAGSSNYLAQKDVRRPLVLTIEDVVMEKVGQGRDAQRKPVLYWEQDVKPMVCNVTVWEDFLQEEFGDDPDEWIGRQVEVYVDPSIEFGGKRVGGLRLRLPDLDDEEDDEEEETRPRRKSKPKSSKSRRRPTEDEDEYDDDGDESTE